MFPKRWTIRAGAQSWVVHERSKCGVEEGLISFGGRDAGSGWLRGMGSDAVAMSAIRSIVASMGAASALSRLSDGEVLAVFGRLLGRGKLHVHAVAVKTSGPSGAPTAPPVIPPAATPKKAAKKAPPVVKCITHIRASVAGTNGKRKETNKRAKNVLKESMSPEESLTTNAPVVLVRGCHDVHLTSVTTPADEPVTWEVKLNQNSGTAPTITPTNGGRSATLTSDQTGSFSVIGTLGSCKVVWNVVFVWVKVDVGTSTTTKRKKFADGGSGGGSCSFNSGAFTAGNYGWEGTAKVKLVGGGTDGKLGMGKVKLKILQNGMADTLSAHYDGAHVLREVPKGGLPVLDATSAGSPFITNPTAGKITAIADGFQWWSGDSPAGGFPTVYKTTTKALKTISGVNGFQTAVASVSDDALNSIVVHAKAAWAADFSGTFAGTYTPTTADVTGDAAFSLISDATGGQDARDAGFETFPPVFNDGVDLL